KAIIIAMVIFCMVPSKVVRAKYVPSERTACEAGHSRQKFFGARSRLALGLLRQANSGQQPTIIEPPSPIPIPRPEPTAPENDPTRPGRLGALDAFIGRRPTQDCQNFAEAWCSADAG